MDTLEALLIGLKSEDAKIRSNAVYLLGRNHFQEALDPIIELLHNDPDPKVRAMTTGALTNLGDIKATEPLIEAFLEPSHTFHLSIAFTLAKLKDPRSIEPLFNEFINPSNSWHKRNAAAWVLVHFKVERILPILIEWLQDDSVYLRETAAKYLAYFDREELSGLLLTALEKETEEDVYIAIINALKNFPTNEVVEKLISLLPHEAYYMRKESAYVLGLLGDKRGVMPLIQVLTDSNEDINVREIAAYSLGLLGDVRAIKPLQQSFPIPELLTVYHEFAQAIIDAFARIKDLASLAALEELLESPNTPDSYKSKIRHAIKIFNQNNQS